MRIIGLPGRTNRASVVEHAAAGCRPVDRAGLRVRLRRPYGASVRGMPDGHQHCSVSHGRVQRQRHRNAARRGDGGTVAWSAGAGELTMGESGPTTPATVNRSWRELRKERGRKAHGRGAVRYQNGPRQAECQMRYGGDGMRRVWRGLDGWSDDPGPDDVALPQSGRVKTGRRKPPSGRR